MKRVFVFIIAMAMISLVVASCQDDSGNDSPQTLSKNSPLTTMLMRVTHSSTSATGKTTSETGRMGDDYTLPCFVVNLPVTLLVNGQNVTITSLAEYGAVQNALHLCGGSDDDDRDEDDDHDISASFVFPITLTFADGTSQTVATEAELQTAVMSCSDDMDDIDCFEIHFPITIGFNDADGVSHVVTFNDKNDVYVFLVTLGTTETYVITYPISVTNAAGATVVINNNDELLAAIKAADDHCGHRQHDGDDDDHDDDD
jgi:hypothetical protein